MVDGCSEVACNLGVFDEATREGHLRDGASLLAHVRAVRELDDGFELRLPADALAAVATWFHDERRCCPFLTFELRLPSGSDELTLALRGPAGAKEVLRSAGLDASSRGAAVTLDGATTTARPPHG